MVAAAELIRCSVPGCTAMVEYALFVTGEDGATSCPFFCKPHYHEASRSREAVRAGMAA